MRGVKDVRLQVVSTRLTRFLQLLRFNSVRPIKSSTDDGIFTIAVLSRRSLAKLDIFPTIFGNFFSLEQPPRSNNSRDSKLILRGRFLRLLQPFKHNTLSRLRTPRDT